MKPSKSSKKAAAQQNVLPNPPQHFSTPVSRDAFAAEHIRRERRTEKRAAAAAAAADRGSRDAFAPNPFNRDNSQCVSGKVLGREEKEGGGGEDLKYLEAVERAALPATMRCFNEIFCCCK